MPANLENSAMTTGLERSVFISISKKVNAKKCTNYYTIALISQGRKVMLKILQASKKKKKYMNRELPMYNLDLEKAEEPELKLPASIES